MDAYKVFLNSNFEPVSEAEATLIKVVGEDGSVNFYHPKNQNTMKAATAEDYSEFLTPDEPPNADFIIVPPDEASEEKPDA